MHSMITLGSYHEIDAAIELQAVSLLHLIKYIPCPERSSSGYNELIDHLAASQ